MCKELEMIAIHISVCPADVAFLGEYIKTMASVARATNIQQGETNIEMGWLLPTITTLMLKLEKSVSL